MTNERTYALWWGSNMTAYTEDAAEALEWMAEYNEADPDPDAALLVFDEKGMAMIALVDARTQNDR